MPGLISSSSEAQKALEGVIPAWEVSNDDLKASITGPVATFKTGFEEMDAGKLTYYEDVMRKVELYVTPKQNGRLRHRPSFRRGSEAGEMSKLAGEYERRWNYKHMADFFEEHATEEQQKNLYEDQFCFTDYERTKHEMSELLYKVVANACNNEFLPDLLSKLRELIAAPEDAPEENAAEDSAVVSDGEEDEEVLKQKAEQRRKYSPFDTYKDAMDGMLNCLHLILTHYRTYSWRGIFQSGIKSEAEIKADAEAKAAAKADAETRTSQFRYIPRPKPEPWWAPIHELLQREIAEKGPAPAKIEFFYRGVELGFLLDGISYQQMQDLAEREDLKEYYDSIKEARAFYGIKETKPEQPTPSEEAEA